MTYSINSSWQITGKDSLKNSQLAFSIVSKVLWLILNDGGVSEPAGRRVTSILDSSPSSLFSKIGWSLVYHHVMERFMFLEIYQQRNEIQVCSVHSKRCINFPLSFLHTKRFISFLETASSKKFQLIHIMTKDQSGLLAHAKTTCRNEGISLDIRESRFSAHCVHQELAIERETCCCCHHKYPREGSQKISSI